MPSLGNLSKATNGEGCQFTEIWKARAKGAVESELFRDLKTATIPLSVSGLVE